MSPCRGKSIDHVMLLPLQGVFDFLSICYIRHILYIFCISDVFISEILCIFARNLRNMVEMPQTLKFQ